MVTILIGIASAIAIYLFVNVGFGHVSTSVYGCSLWVGMGYKEEIFVSDSSLVYWKGRNFLASSPRCVSYFESCHEAPIDFDTAVEYLMDYKGLTPKEIPNYEYSERGRLLEVSDLYENPNASFRSYDIAMSLSIDDSKRMLSKIDAEMARLEGAPDSDHVLSNLTDWYEFFFQRAYCVV